MENIYVDENGFYDIEENLGFDINLPIRRKNENLETFSDRVYGFIKDKYGLDAFTTGNIFLRRQIWLTSDNPSQDDCNELADMLLENDAIVDALQRNGYIGYDRNYETDDIVEIPTRNDNESIEEFHNRLNQFHEDHEEGKLDDTHRREYNVFIF